MTPALLISGSLLLLVAALWAVPRLADRTPLTAEMQRKVIHVTFGLFCLAFPVLFDNPWHVSLLCGLAIALFIILRVGTPAADGLGRSLHAVGRDSHGEILFALSVAILFHLKGGEVVLYLLPIATITLADAAAALVGSHYGRRLFKIERGHKSLEGVVFFFLFAWIIAMALLLHFSNVPRENIVLLGLIVAFFGASLEAESWRGWDNLLVPVGIYFLVQHNLRADAVALLGIVLIYIALLLSALWVAPRIGVDRHAARVATIVYFFIWMTSSAVNLLTPVAAFACHLLVVRNSPDREEFPHLRVLIAVIGIALFWYVAGELSGNNVFYPLHLSFGCFAAGLLGLAFAGRLVVMAAGVAVLWLLVTQRLLFQGAFETADLVFRAASFAGMTAIAVLGSRPHGLLSGNRYPKLAIVSSLIAALFLPVARI